MGLRLYISLKALPLYFVTTAPFLLSGSPNLTSRDELLAMFKLTLVGGSGHPVKYTRLTIVEALLPIMGLNNPFNNSSVISQPTDIKFYHNLMPPD